MPTLVSGVCEEEGQLSLAEIDIVVTAEALELTNSLQEGLIVVKSVCDWEQIVPLILSQD